MPIRSEPAPPTFRARRTPARLSPASLSPVGGEASRTDLSLLLFFAGLGSAAACGAGFGALQALIGG